MRVLRILGHILFWGCGLYLYIVSLIFYNALWGTIGLIVAIFVFPVAELFPIVVWIITGQFPGLLFLIWGIGWFGMILVAIASRERKTKWIDPRIINK